MIAIEKNIPLPPARGGAKKYHFELLGIDESFLVKGGSARSISACASRAARLTGHKYAVRKLRDGVRVWRIA